MTVYHIWDPGHCFWPKTVQRDYTWLKNHRQNYPLSESTRLYTYEVHNLFLNPSQIYVLTPETDKNRKRPKKEVGRSTTLEVFKTGNEQARPYEHSKDNLTNGGHTTVDPGRDYVPRTFTLQVGRGKGSGYTSWEVKYEKVREVKEVYKIFVKQVTNTTNKHLVDQNIPTEEVRTFTLSQRNETNKELRSDFKNI